MNNWVDMKTKGKRSKSLIMIVFFLLTSAMHMPLVWAMEQTVQLVVPGCGA